MHSLNSLTWRNLTAHPLRSILTVLAIALGVGMVLAAAVVGQAPEIGKPFRVETPSAPPPMSNFYHPRCVSEPGSLGPVSRPCP